MEKNQQNHFLAVLQKAAEGMRYSSETEAPLEAFLWEDSGKLTRKHLLELAGVKVGTTVEEEPLGFFFYAVPQEDKDAFDKLAVVLKEQLSGIKVFKIGNEAEKQAFVVGKTPDRQWAGLKTTVVET